nr:MAG: RNA-dependent RNA polymerase [Hangzhou tombus-like virus 1]
MESLGCHVYGACLPHMDHSDQNTMIAGVMKRIGAKLPQPDRHSDLRAQRRFAKVMSEFRRFVSKWLKRNLPPLPADTDYDFESWLRDTNYPEWRKEELRLANSEIVDKYDKKYYKVKCFMKDETYPTYKHARGIFARSDYAKCLLGPFFKRIEERLYSLPQFIKHIPVKDRPVYISNMLNVPGAKYIATDYTAYESHFTQLVMQNCEFVLYRHMTKLCPDQKYFKWAMDNVLAGYNTCTFKRFKLGILATRMSGEMCTSLGNGFSNLMLMLFACHRIGSKCTGVVEGDDGLFVCSPRAPTAKEFSDIGFTIKIEKHDSLSTASFCGIVFDEIDKVNVTDPMEVLVGFGWSKTPYVGAKPTRKLELLRSKSLSMLYQYPGCPIIQSLALYGLRVTKHIDMRRFLEKERSLNWWDRNRLIAAMKAWDEDKLALCREVPMRTRLLVEKRYGISVQDQIKIEKYLDSLTKLQELKHISIYKYVKFEWGHYFSHYCSRFLGNYPILNVPRYNGELKKYRDKIGLSRRLQNSGRSKYIL